MRSFSICTMRKMRQARVYRLSENRLTVEPKARSRRCRSGRRIPKSGRDDARRRAKAVTNAGEGVDAVRIFTARLLEARVGGHAWSWAPRLLWRLARATTPCWLWGLVQVCRSSARAGLVEGALCALIHAWLEPRPTAAHAGAASRADEFVAAQGRTSAGVTCGASEERLEVASMGVLMGMRGLCQVLHARACLQARKYHSANTGSNTPSIPVTGGWLAQQQRTAIILLLEG